MKLTILGCGPSGGVPLIDGGWGACNPDNPKNYRTRTSAVVEKIGHNGDTLSLLIDSSPDLRFQAIKNGIKMINGIIYTHSHADHIHGIDDLRQFNRAINDIIPSLMNRDTFDYIQKSFEYALIQPKEKPIKFHSKPTLFPYMVEYNKEIDFCGFKVIAIEQMHGRIKSTGYIIDNIAYCTDLDYLPPYAFNILKDIDCLVISLFSMVKHPSHASFDTIIEWIEKISPKKAILTHMGGTIDYEEIKKILPANVEPAFDGMILDI